MGLGADTTGQLKVRVLHMTPELPFEPGGGGGRGREFFLCRHLVEHGHQVLNISPVLPQEAHWAQALRDVGAENWVVQRPSSHAREAARAMLAEPAVLTTAVKAPVRALEMHVFWVGLRGLVQRAITEWHPDVVVIGHDMAAGWVQGLPSALPAVITLHNLTWHWYLSRARLRRGMAALALRVEATRYRHHLLGLLPRFSAAVAVSTLEAEELRRSSEVPVSVIPSGVDTQTLRPAPEQDGPPRVVFTGTLSYPPNSQGIVWFADQVWPRVRRQLPNAELDVVGRNPPPSVSGLSGRPGINVLGEVPVMAPYYHRAHVVIVPILTGAGIRMKIVEAMSAGRAIVSTTLGWEGLPHVVPNQHLLVADRPEDFAEATVRLLSEPSARRDMAARARHLAEQRYDWRQLGDEQLAVLEKATSRR